MVDNITVLLIEDDAADVKLLANFLKSNHEADYTLIHRSTIQEATVLLRVHKAVDVILCDVTLPDSTAAKIFQQLKRVAANLPVVFLANQREEKLAIRALQKGAEDYLLKGQFNSASLVRSLRYAMERKKFQNEAKRARENSRALRNKTLLLKEKSSQLQALNDVKDDFIALASHQLRTPATGVRQYINMLREDYFGEMNQEQRRMLDIVHESNERQLRIVDDLLKIAKVDSGYFTLKKSPCDLVELIQEVINTYTDKISLKNQAIIYKPSKKKLMARIDARQMRMVIENLIDNAHRYSPAGRQISIKLAKAANRININIQDEGVGISKPDMAKLFQKFRRINNPLSETFGGSGLGLYWAKRIVSLHGGDINVYSSIGKGTIFTITI